MTAPNMSRRIKTHVVITLVAAGIAILSFAAQYLVFGLLGISTSESFALGWFLTTQLPFALIAGVMGIVSFFYGMRDSTWRALRIVLLIVALILLLVFVAPITLGVILHR